MNYRIIFVIVSFLILITAIITAITNQKLRCFFKLDSGQICLSGFVEVKLVVRNKKYQPIQNVEVRFLSQGAPDVKYTDSNGFSAIQIPERKDIEITLIKDGFETLNQVVNVENSYDDRTRIFQLKEINLESQSNPSISPPMSTIVSTTPQYLSETQKVEDNDYRVQLQGCKRSNEKVKCDLLITNLANKDRYFRLWIGGSRMISDSGDVFSPKEVQVGISSDSSSGDTLVTNIPIKGSITFEEIPKQINNFSILELNYDGAGQGPSGKIKIYKISLR
ncbi:hypothetical protein [Anabaena sp. CCY 9910]|uniref:hypothetical protein n=1 Tax=Anabaena sp. CCY 9910 TaxID=3103870 RepID=UPI0039E13BA6